METFRVPKASIRAGSNSTSLKGLEIESSGGNTACFRTVRVALRALVSSSFLAGWLSDATCKRLGGEG